MEKFIPWSDAVMSELPTTVKKVSGNFTEDSSGKIETAREKSWLVD